MILLPVLLCANAYSQSRNQSVSFRNRAVDLVILKNGQRLYGTILPGTETRLLVRREWLTAAAADLYEQEIRSRDTNPRPAISTPIDRAIENEIRRRRQQTPDDLEFIGLLSETRQRINPEEGKPSPWLVLTIPSDRIQRQQTQTPQARTTGFLGIINQIENVETAAWQNIAVQLAEIPLPERVTDLPAPPAMINPAEQLQKILAALEVRTARSVDLIQFGDQFISDDGTQNVEALLPALLSGPLQQQLSELLNAGAGSFGQGNGSPLSLPALKSPPASVWKQLKDRNVETIRVSAFGIQLTEGRATVRIAVYRRKEGGQSELILKAEGSASSAEVNSDQTKPLEQDARIEQIASLFSGLGSSQSDITRALRLGAAMRMAMSKAETAVQNQFDNILSGREAEQRIAPPEEVALKSGSDGQTR